MSGLAARSSPMRWMAAEKSLSKALPGKTESTLPVPSNLNWFTPYVADHLQADIAEGGVILRAGERVSVGDDLVPGGLAELDALLLGLGIAAPGRHPHAGRGAVLLRCLLHRREAVGESLVELPQGLVVVPAVVEQVGIQLYAALLASSCPNVFTRSSAPAWS